MFTGLIEETGTVTSTVDRAKGKRITIAASRTLDDLDIDHSIAVNGVCLTVVERTPNTFEVDVVEETLRKTTIGNLHPDSPVNLERAVRLNDRLGGHIVQGHVDTTGVVDLILPGDAGWEMWIRFPSEYRKWLIPVGSICINGVSLTVAELEAERCKVAIIPHTLSVTTFNTLNEKDTVNLEFDVLAKYIDNIATYRIP
ncbi:MAG TPA: riboflavin synthase [Candidatus Didemnitutus sp.]|nr:riboflavin synthase [Candidatus Didemnitutus sp.]